MATTITGTTIDTGRVDTDLIKSKTNTPLSFQLSDGTAVGNFSNTTGALISNFGLAVGGTGAVNTLDDYEEGTFNVSCGGQTTQNNLGRYVKVGQMCTVSFNFVANANVSGTGTALNLGGFPFVAGSGCHTIVNLMLWNGDADTGSDTGTFANGTHIVGDLNDGNASFYVRTNSTGANPYHREDLLRAGSALRVSCTYRTS